MESMDRACGFSEAFLLVSNWDELLTLWRECPSRERQWRERLLKIPSAGGGFSDGFLSATEAYVRVLFGDTQLSSCENIGI